MNSIVVKAPAKINLYLDVINKRPDGYHNIETIFHKIDLFDWIKISLLKTKKINIKSNQAIPTDKTNTVYKAAGELIRHFNLRCGFDILIDKRIPKGAGLGGGSSDAASALKGILKLLNLEISNQDLLEIALKIGADVPFFASGYKTARASGVGERLSAIKSEKKLHFLVVWPKIEISTPFIYKKVSLFLTKQNHNANIMRSKFNIYSLTNISNILYNKMEEAILPSYPVLSKVKKQLKQAGAEGVLVSGSGSAVYGIFSTRKEALRAENKIKNKNWQLFLTNSY